MEIIQSVEYSAGYMRITFESGWKVWLKKNTDTPFPLQTGMQVSRQKFEKFILLHQYPLALEKAVSLLAARSRSRKEIEEKLQRAQYDTEVVSMVLCKLEKEKLLDDSSFSEQWVQSRKKKYGAARIVQELRHKGIDPETINKTMEAFSEQEQLENAISLAIRKIRSIKDVSDTGKIFQRVTGMLLRRGYTWDTVKKAFEIAAASENIR